MHKSALAAASAFFSAYQTPLGSRILDLGALDVRGSLRTLVPAGMNYVGADSNYGPGVVVVIEDNSHLPFHENDFNVVLSSYRIEHDIFFWQTFLEVLRILNPGGLFYLCAPSNGVYHRAASDNWRLYPDAGKALEAWGRRNGYEVDLVESFVLPQADDEPWNDFVAVFQKQGNSLESREPQMHKQFPAATNLWLKGAAYPSKETRLPEDRRKLLEAVYQIGEQSESKPMATSTEPNHPVCNLCGGSAFGPGPGGRMAATGFSPRCLGCDSLERQRIVQRLMQALPIGWLDQRKTLQFGASGGIKTTAVKSREVVKFVNGVTVDLDTASRKTGAYDLITFNHMLEYLPDALAVFDEMLRMLSPQGLIVGCFAVPLDRGHSQDFVRPAGSYRAWHMFGKDAATYFGCSSKGVAMLAVEEIDPCTGTREVVHFFAKQPADAAKLKDCFTAWSNTAVVVSA